MSRGNALFAAIALLVLFVIPLLWNLLKFL